MAARARAGVPGGWLLVPVWASVVLLGACGAGGMRQQLGDAPPPAGSPSHVTTADAGPSEGHDSGNGGEAESAVIPAPVAFGGLEQVRSFRSVRGHTEPPTASRLRIPAIGVDTSLVTLGREPGGTVEVPADWNRAGWFREGPTPGQRGPAVILGHVDSRAGPAVFYHLRELQQGDEVLVDLADGRTVAFTVERVERHPKDRFPTRAVYYPTLEPALRLVTCGGSFDTSAGSYRDNVIVFAEIRE